MHRKTPAPVSFLIKLQAATLLQKRDSGASVFLWILWTFWEHFFYKTPLGDCFCVLFVTTFLDHFIVHFKLQCYRLIFCFIFHRKNDIITKFLELFFNQVLRNLLFQSFKMTRASSWNLEWFCLKKSNNFKKWIKFSELLCFLNEISLFKLTV